MGLECSKSPIEHCQVPLTWARKERKATRNRHANMQSGRADSASQQCPAVESHLQNSVKEGDVKLPKGASG